MIKKELFYFFSKNLLKGLLAFLALLIFILFVKYLADHNETAVFEKIKTYPVALFTLFFLNEISLGILPPEIFMMLYTNETPIVYWQWISLMTVLSYLGGTGAFLAGRKMEKNEWSKSWMKHPNIQKYLFYYNRFDGILLTIAAITPLPFSIICFISGFTGHTFLHMAKFAFPVRMLRFFPYAYLLYYALENNFTDIFLRLF